MGYRAIPNLLKFHSNITHIYIIGNIGRLHGLIKQWIIWQGHTNTEKVFLTYFHSEGDGTRCTESRRKYHHALIIWLGKGRNEFLSFSNCVEILIIGWSYVTLPVSFGLQIIAMQFSFVFSIFLLIVGIYAQTFCRCENEQDLSYLLLVIDDEIKQEFQSKFPDINYHSDCSYCSKLHCQYNFEKNNDNKQVSLHELNVNCFKRESSRDKLVIYGFISLTVSLLFYPLISQFIQKWFRFCSSIAELLYLPQPNVIGENADDGPL